MVNFDPTKSPGMFQDFIPPAENKKEGDDKKEDEKKEGFFPFQQLNQYPILAGEEVMKEKAHGTCEKPVQADLKYGCDFSTADRICCFNRHYAEYSGYAFKEPRTWVQEIQDVSGPVTYYDSVTGKPLFKAPVGRSVQDFIDESKKHGWPSFRDDEVVWDHVRCLKNGEAVSVDGTHLGHNLPDWKGNRYCINLVSVAGSPDEKKETVESSEPVMTA